MIRQWRIKRTRVHNKLWTVGEKGLTKTQKMKSGVTQMYLELTSKGRFQEIRIACTLLVLT